MVSLLDIFPSINTVLLVFIFAILIRIWVRLQQVTLTSITNQRMLMLMNKTCPILAQQISTGVVSVTPYASTHLASLREIFADHQ